MNKIITGDVALSALRQAVGGKPEGYRLESGCYYTNEDGTPRCLVADALHRLGVPLPKPFGIEGVTIENGGCINGARVSSDVFLKFLDANGFTLTNEALHAFTAAQVVQDEHETWKRALYAAERHVATTREEPNYPGSRLVNPHELPAAVADTNGTIAESLTALTAFGKMTQDQNLSHTDIDKELVSA